MIDGPLHSIYPRSSGRGLGFTANELNRTGPELMVGHMFASFPPHNQDAMKTDISKFCRDYESLLGPVNDSIQGTIDACSASAIQSTLKPTIAGLNDVKHRLKNLTDKILGQQAYMLIFGPLKSGKSTLMNALSGSYVSEVTSLPAYPCLVYVKHGQKKSYALSRYNGKVSEFSSNEHLQDKVKQCHVSLSDRLCQSEAEGRDFEPGLDYAEAIRRIDIQLPISGLSDSNTVLVDTPGLYSRMKFGYDLMTREFRNSAACAVFVVKTDNLYLEQVFDEFTELLKIFSRIFLVVNIDASKKDLSSDGTLMPSLESQHPEQIIKAFETLSMSASLRDAYDTGRLRIFSIDLLNAASKLLTAGPDGDTNGDASMASFHNFTEELTSYLNSNEYFREFMGDSLKQGQLFCREVVSFVAPDAMEEFRKMVSKMDKDIGVLKTKRLAADEMLNADKDGVFLSVQRRRPEIVEGMAEHFQEELLEVLMNELNEWFSSHESLLDLGASRWSPALNEFAVKIAKETFRKSRKVLETPMAGADFSEEAIKLLATLEFMPSEIGKIVLSDIEGRLEVPQCSITIEDHRIPVKKSIWDWIFFRSHASVRRKVFGSPDQLDQPMSPAAKAKRIGGDGKAALVEIFEEYVGNHFPQIPTICAKQIITEYIEDFSVKLTERLEDTRNDIESQIKNLQSKIDETSDVRNSVQTLEEQMSGFEKSIDNLFDEHIKPEEPEVSAIEAESDEAQPESESNPDNIFDMDEDSLDQPTIAVLPDSQDADDDEEPVAVSGTTTRIEDLDLAVDAKEGSDTDELEEETGEPAASDDDNDDEIPPSRIAFKSDND